MKDIQQPLSNTQLEILKAFSFELDSTELLEFRNVITQFFAKRAISSANKVWDEKEMSDQDVERLLKTKMRKTS